MGQKVHPVGFRLGVIKGWQAKWYDDKHYTQLVQEDLAIRKAILKKYPDADVSLIEIERGPHEVTVAVHTARPGIVIGRGGQTVDETRSLLQRLTGRKVRLNVQEIREPELDAYLVAKNVASQLGKRVSYRRALKQTITRSRQHGAQGIKINVSGRLGGAEIARKATEREGRVPLHTLRADIDYGFAEARTTVGRIGVKVWIYKGDILPKPEFELEMRPPVEAEPAEKVKPEEDATAETSEIPQGT